MAPVAPVQEEERRSILVHREGPPTPTERPTRTVHFEGSTNLSKNERSSTRNIAINETPSSPILSTRSASKKRVYQKKTPPARANDDCSDNSSGEEEVVVKRGRPEKTAQKSGTFIVRIVLLIRHFQLHRLQLSKHQKLFPRKPSSRILQRIAVAVAVAVVRKLRILERSMETKEVPIPMRKRHPLDRLLHHPDAKVLARLSTSTCMDRNQPTRSAKNAGLVIFIKRPENNKDFSSFVVVVPFSLSECFPNPVHFVAITIFLCPGEYLISAQSHVLFFPQFILE